MKAEQHQLVRKEYLPHLLRNLKDAGDSIFAIFRHTTQVQMWQVRSDAYSEGKHNLCCREILVIDNKLLETSGGNPCCITEHEGFQPVCLDVWVLQTAEFQTQQEFGRHATSRPVHKLVHTIYIYIII